MKFDFHKKIPNKILWAAFIGLGLLALVLPVQKEEPATPIDKSVVSADTFIPKGFVLVPIELSNANSLSSLVGEVGGVVDLYLPQAKGPSRKVASRLKILRAPYNPDLYAVLVREQESGTILNYTGPFVAVVQNPQAQGQNLSDNKVKKIQIDYQN